jgi:hypothetical protein
MIAYDNRYTQEITPTGTIITVYGLTTSVLSLVVSTLTTEFEFKFIKNDSLQRVIPCLLLVIALAVAVPLARRELKLKSKSERHNNNLPST